jgi:hypothetical protein
VRPRHPREGKVFGPDLSRVPQAAQNRVFFVRLPAFISRSGKGNRQRLSMGRIVFPSTCVAVAVCVAVAGLFVSASSSALGVEPVPITSASPQDGTVVTAATPVQLEIVSPVQHLPGLAFDVTSDQAQQPDGELEAGLWSGLQETGSGRYQSGEEVPFLLGSLLAPGKYYWQVRDGGSAYGGKIAPLQLSPAYWFIVGPGTPQLTMVRALEAVKASIREHTAHDAEHLKDSCANLGEIEVECHATWATSTRLSAGTLVFAGAFRISEDAGVDHVSFRGTRERHECTKRKRVCRVAVRWSDNPGPSTRFHPVSEPEPASGKHYEEKSTNLPNVITTG